DNATLFIPNTLRGSTATVTLSATNTGAGTGSVNSIVLGNGMQSVFQLVSLPSLPAAVPPSQQLRFGIRFSPQLQDRFSDTLRLDLNGRILTINLQAQGIGPQFGYATVSGNVTTVLPAGGTINLADTSVGQTSSLGIAVVNIGTGDGQIPVLS